MPPSLNSVPRPGTTVVENPLAVTTLTGRSTGTRGQRRVLWGTSMLPIIFSSSRAYNLPRYKRTVFNSTVGATGDFLAILARQMLGEHRKEGAGELKSPRI